MKSMLIKFAKELVGLPFRFILDKLNGEDKESRESYDSFPKVFELKYVGQGGSGLYHLNHPSAKSGMASYITDSIGEIKFRVDEVITIEKSACIPGLLNRNWNFVATSPNQGEPVRVKFHAKYPDAFLAHWKAYVAGQYQPEPE